MPNYMRMRVVEVHRRFCVYVYACVVRNRERERERELETEFNVKGDNTFNY